MRLQHCLNTLRPPKAAAAPSSTVISSGAAGATNLEMRAIPRCEGARVTFVGFGALEIGRDWGLGGDTARPAEADAIAVTRGVLDLGINLLDTASAYLLSEERIGKAAADRRAQYFLASKCGEYSIYGEQTTAYDFSYEAVSRSIDRSLELLRCVRQLPVHCACGGHFAAPDHGIAGGRAGPTASTSCKSISARTSRRSSMRVRPFAPCSMPSGPARFASWAPPATATTLASVLRWVYSTWCSSHTVSSTARTRRTSRRAGPQASASLFGAPFPH